MKLRPFILTLLLIPQLSFGAERIRPSGVTAGPSKSSSTTPPLSQPKSGYRYAHAPTRAAWDKWSTCGHVEMGLEALLWRLATPGFVYARSEGSFVAVKPGYDWGVRGYLGYAFPNCWDVRLSYLYFDSHFADSRSAPPILTPIFGSPSDQTFASGSVADKFQAVDFDVGVTLHCGSHLRLRAFGGGRWVKQQGSELYDYISFTEVETAAKQTTRFSGAGPRFGIWSGLWPLPCGYLEGFSIDGSIALAALIARRSNLLLSNDTEDGHPKATLIVPNYDVKVKANYCIDWDCWNWTIYVAYELQWYQDARERFTQTLGSGDLLSAVSGMGYAGWSFGLKLNY